ncbi:MAG TPA: hypothetical protein VK471_02855 [Solirubrobacterales bacterium]|nr:hypothetical protein [Solirubrobacterales bacterium]
MDSLPSDRRGHVDHSGPWSHQAPERRGTTVAEQCPVSVGEHGGEPTTLSTHSSVADGEYLAMERLEPLRVEPHLDRLVAKAKRQ